MVLIVALVFAVLCAAAWIRQSTAQQVYPRGSSFSTQPSGSRALMLWMNAAGIQAQRREAAAGSKASPDELLLIEPLVPLLPPDKARLDAVADRGGTLVLAGNFAIRSFLDALGITSKVGQLEEQGMTDGGLIVSMNTALSLQASDGTPLLTAADGSVLALREPYRQGTVIALASATPLTNEGLRENDTARFVYEQIVSRMPANAVVAFDEAYHQPPGGGSPLSFGPDTILPFALRNSAGAAVLYACGLVFLFLVLSGRRLGPPVPPAQAEAASRTMYEQVQAVAGLYRRSRQFAGLRAHFTTHYRRQATRALGTTSGELDRALAAVESAPSEKALAADVASVEALLADLPNGWRRPA
ncbi:MAG: DUF4350 domain-containing protein [Chloroflexi bacterium]|nr:DUF4350 domain-containing protein [Chloroflexota bacterium]